MSAHAEFIRLANSPLLWQVFANDLRVCAERIGELHVAAIDAAMTGDTSHPHLTHTGQVFLMLAGMAIENLANALLLQRKKTSVTTGQISGANLKGHNVAGKLKRAQVRLSAPDSELVERLQKAVIWSGRYPIPTNAVTFEAEQIHTSLRSDVDDFRRLFEQLTSELSRRVGKP